MSRAIAEGMSQVVVGRRVFEAVGRTALTNDSLLLALQIGNLDDYYHFYHSKTFKRSTWSSRGPHTFLRMDPQVRTALFAVAWVCGPTNGWVWIFMWP